MKDFAGFQFPDDETKIVSDIQRTHLPYQSRQRSRSLEYVTDFSLAVDVGAHVGLWSRDLSNYFQSVLAFEPLELHRECLRRNVRPDIVHVVPMALGNQHGAVAFDCRPGETAESRIAVDRNGSVPIGRLDDFEIHSLGYLKVDTGGFELQVLKGAQQTLLKHQPIVVFEQSDCGVEFFGETEPYAGVRYLEGLGAIVLDRIDDDFIMGWAAVPGRVRAARPLPLAEKLAAIVHRHDAGDLRGAELGYQNLLRDDPANSDVLHLLACVYAQMDKLERAVAIMESAISLAPGCASFHRSLGVFLARLGKHQAAIRVLETALKLDPSDSRTRRELEASRAAVGQSATGEAPATEAFSRVEGSRSHEDAAAGVQRIDTQHAAPPAPQSSPIPSPFDVASNNTVRLDGGS
jgi:FkbM family methyltransferase